MMDVMQSPPTRAAPRGYFGELVDPATYKALVYHLLALPLAVLYFALLVAGFAAGLGLLVVVIGAALLLLSLWLMLAFGELERGLGSALLGVRLFRARNPLMLRQDSLMDWLRVTLADAGTYKVLLYLLLKLPFSMLMFALGSGLIGLSLVLIAAPLAPLIAHDWQVSVPFHGQIYGGTVLTLGVMSVGGVALLVFSVSLLNLISRGWAFLSIALLTEFGEGVTAQRDVQALQRGAALVAYSGDLQGTLDALLAQGLDATATGGALVLQGQTLLAAQGLTAQAAKVLPATLATFEAPAPDRARLTRAPLPGDAAELRVGTVASYRLSVAGEALGSLHALYPLGMEPSGRELRLWAALADQAAVAVRTDALIRAAQLQAGEQERARLARDLHDSVAQALYGIALGARTARAMLERDPARAASAIDYTVSLADGASSEMKSLLFALRPDALEEGGLTPALSRLAEVLRVRYQLDASFSGAEEPTLGLDAKGALYRIAQEAAHNAVKHARAKRVELSLAHEAAAWALTVRDDGRGFDPDARPNGSLGLKSMRERATGIGADLTLHSRAGEGTTVHVRLPVQEGVVTL